jgi:redox-sensitive bicupin YhaK (pirin superfamily)
VGVSHAECCGPLCDSPPWFGSPCVAYAPPADWAGFLYAVEGEGEVDGDLIAEGDVITRTEGRSVDVRSDSGLRAVAVSGQSHDEPIRQRGPFVL